VDLVEETEIIDKVEDEEVVNEFKGEKEKEDV
jgi:hypothetical protein